MGAAPLPRSAGQHRGDRLPEPGMRVRDDQLDATQPTRHQVAQERGPPGAVFGGEHVHSEDLAVALGVDAGGDHRSDIDDTAVLAALDRQRVQPHIRVATSVQGTRAERRHLTVQAAGELGDLGLRQALDAECLHQTLDPPGRHPAHIALGDHRD
jgi:hypothetical protein